MAFKKSVLFCKQYWVACWTIRLEALKWAWYCLCSISESFSVMSSSSYCIYGTEKWKTYFLVTLKEQIGNTDKKQNNKTVQTWLCLETYQFKQTFGPLVLIQMKVTVYVTSTQNRPGLVQFPTGLFADFWPCRGRRRRCQGGWRWGCYGDFWSKHRMPSRAITVAEKNKKKKKVTQSLLKSMLPLSTMYLAPNDIPTRMKT